MSERWVGFCVSSLELQIVALEFDTDDNASVLQENNWKLQVGDRYEAYGRMFERVSTYLQEGRIDHAVVMGSTPNPAGTRQAHLHAAELRGVVITAASLSTSKLSVVSKAILSRGYGKRNVADYVKDDEYWTQTLPVLKLKGSREAAILILNARKS